MKTTNCKQALENLKNMIIENNQGNDKIGDFKITTDCFNSDSLKFDFYCDVDDNHYSINFKIFPDDSSVYYSFSIFNNWYYECGKYLEDYMFEYSDNLEENIKDASTGWYDVLTEVIELYDNPECD